MYPWISRTLDFWLQFCEKKCGLHMDVYGRHAMKVMCRIAVKLMLNFQILNYFDRKTFVFVFCTCQSRKKKTDKTEDLNVLGW